MGDQLKSEAIQYLRECYLGDRTEFLVKEFRKYGGDGLRAYCLLGEEIATNPDSSQSVWYTSLFEWVIRCISAEAEARILSEVLAPRTPALGAFLKWRRDCGPSFWVTITLMMESDLSDVNSLKGFLWGLSQERPDCREDLLSDACGHIVKSLLAPDPELQQLALQSAMSLGTPNLAPGLVNALKERHRNGSGDPEEERKLCAPLAHCLIWPGPAYQIEKRVIEAAVRLVKEELDAFPVLHLVAVQVEASLKSTSPDRYKVRPPLLWRGFESSTSAGDSVIRDALAQDFSKQHRWLDKILTETRFYEECTTLFGTAIASAGNAHSRRHAVCHFIAEAESYLSGKKAAGEGMNLDPGSQEEGLESPSSDWLRRWLAAYQLANFSKEISPEAVLAGCPCLISEAGMKAVLETLRGERASGINAEDQTFLLNLRSEISRRLDQE
jgi:hypothetical protein